MCKRSILLIPIAEYYLFLTLPSLPCRPLSFPSFFPLPSSSLPTTSLPSNFLLSFQSLLFILSLPFLPSLSSLPSLLFFPSIPSLSSLHSLSALPSFHIYPSCSLDSSHRALLITKTV
jgi:hypothetical protein